MVEYIVDKLIELQPEDKTSLDSVNRGFVQGCYSEVRTGKYVWKRELIV